MVSATPKPPAQRLHINLPPVKRKYFYTSLWVRYGALIAKPMVVGAMDTLRLHDHLDTIPPCLYHKTVYISREHGKL